MINKAGFNAAADCAYSYPKNRSYRWGVDDTGKDVISNPNDAVFDT